MYKRQAFGLMLTGLESCTTSLRGLSPASRRDLDTDTHQIVQTTCTVQYAVRKLAAIVTGRQQFTWRRTANSLLSPDVADCVRRTPTHVKFGEPTHGSVIARLPLLGHEHGTVCQSTCETPNYHSNNSGGHSRHIFTSIYLVTDSCSAE